MMEQIFVCGFGIGGQMELITLFAMMKKEKACRLLIFFDYQTFLFV